MDGLPPASFLTEKRPTAPESPARSCALPSEPTSTMHLEVLTHSGMKTGTCEQRLLHFASRVQAGTLVVGAKGTKISLPVQVVLLLCYATPMLSLDWVDLAHRDPQVQCF